MSAEGYNKQILLHSQEKGGTRGEGRKERMESTPHETNDGYLIYWTKGSTTV